MTPLFLLLICVAVEWKEQWLFSFSSPHPQWEYILPSRGGVWELGSTRNGGKKYVGLRSSKTSKAFRRRRKGHPKQCSKKRASQNSSQLRFSPLAILPE